MLFATKFSTAPYLAVSLVAVGQEYLAVNVVNGRSVSCKQGQCSWDLPADSGTSGTVQIVRCIRDCAFRIFVG